MKNFIKIRVKYMYNRWLDLRVVAVGGNSNNGGNAGVFYVNANNSSGNRSALIGGLRCWGYWQLAEKRAGLMR